MAELLQFFKYLSYETGYVNDALRSYPKSEGLYPRCLGNRIYCMLDLGRNFVYIARNLSWDLCKTPLFAQFLCQAQILILKILNVFPYTLENIGLAIKEVLEK